MWAWLWTNSVVYKKCLLKKACIRLSAKKASASGGTKSPRPLTKFYTPAKFNNSITSIITNDFSWMWAIEPFCWLFQIIAQTIHQNEWFQDWFFKSFWEGASSSPLPCFFSGFALSSQALRTLESGFALDSRALYAVDLGFALNFWLGILVWLPKVNS